MPIEVGLPGPSDLSWLGLSSDLLPKIAFLWLGLLLLRLLQQRAGFAKGPFSWSLKALLLALLSSLVICVAAACMPLPAWHDKLGLAAGLLVLASAWGISHVLPRAFSFAANEQLNLASSQLAQLRHELSESSKLFQAQLVGVQASLQAAEQERTRWKARCQSAEAAVTESEAMGQQLVAARDTAERRANEFAVKQSEALFRQLTDSMPQIIWTANAEGEIDYCNARFYELMGPFHSGDTSLSWFALVHEEDRQACLQRWQESVRLGRPYHCSYRLLDGKNAGVYRWHLGRAHPNRDGRGNIVKWFGTSTDIDDQKRAEEELLLANESLEKRVSERTHALELANTALKREIAEKERSNGELEQFAYVASHDLQEPLRAVASYVGLLAMRYEGELDERAQGYILHAVEGTRRMQAFINDLLAYSRVRPGQLGHQSVDLNNLVTEVLGSLAVSMREVAAEVSVGTLPQVEGYASMLWQLFQNLLSNALKFRDVRPLRLRITASQEHGEWVIAVEDNGIGFDLRHKERIFQIFQRLHSRDRYPGTGLGLAICRRVVDQHGGRIWAHSVQGEGSTFYFSLPVSLGKNAEGKNSPV